MVMEALTSCEAGARAGIRPSKAPSSLGKRPRNLPRSPLQVGSLRKKSGRSQKSALSQNLPVLAFHSRTQGFSNPLAGRRSNYPPSSPNLVLTRPTARAATPYQAFRDSITWLSRDTRSRNTPYWVFGRGAPGETVQTQIKLPPLVNRSNKT